MCTREDNIKMYVEVRNCDHTKQEELTQDGVQRMLQLMPAQGRPCDRE